MWPFSSAAQDVSEFHNVLACITQLQLAPLTWLNSRFMGLQLLNMHAVVYFKCSCWVCVCVCAWLAHATVQFPVCNIHMCICNKVLSTQKHHLGVCLCVCVLAVLKSLEIGINYDRLWNAKGEDLQYIFGQYLESFLPSVGLFYFILHPKNPVQPKLVKLKPQCIDNNIKENPNNIFYLNTAWLESWYTSSSTLLWTPS